MRDLVNKICAFGGSNCPNDTVGQNDRSTYTATLIDIRDTTGKRCRGHICAGETRNLALSLLQAQICSNHYICRG